MRSLLYSPLLGHVLHAFSTRIGGVSRAPFDSLNLGNPGDLPPERKDPLPNMRENWRRILAAIGCEGRELVQVYQVHGGGVHTVPRGGQTHPGFGPGFETRADAIVTDDPGRVLAVRVADCTPVLLASGDGRVVGVVHAGWRGVIAGVAPAAVRAMRGLGAEAIAAAIGPCISAAHFEVGPEVAAQFRSVFGPGGPVERETPDGKAFVDLKEALRRQLAGAGVERIDISDRCTYRDSAEFFSHRRDKGLTGRTAGVIGPAPR